MAPKSLTSEISKISDKICKASWSFEGAKMCAVPQASQACALSSAHCPILQRPGPLSVWFSLALAARRECAEPGKVALALGSILSGFWGLSLQVIKEASSPAAGGMEAPTSPVMPCKMDLDKVMVSNRPAEVLCGAAVAEAGERRAGGALSSGCCMRSPSHPRSTSVGLTGLPATGEGEQGSPGTGRHPSPAQDGPRADSGRCWRLCIGMLLTGCLFRSPCSGCHRRSTPPTRTAW